MNIKPIKHHIYFRHRLSMPQETLSTQMSLEVPVTPFTWYCQAVCAFLVGHLSLASCLPFWQVAFLWRPASLQDWKLNFFLYMSCIWNLRSLCLPSFAPARMASSIQWSKLQETVKGREAWHAAVCGVVESDATQPLNKNNHCMVKLSLSSIYLLIKYFYII